MESFAVNWIYGLTIQVSLYNKLDFCNIRDVMKMFEIKLDFHNIRDVMKMFEIKLDFCNIRDVTKMFYFITKGYKIKLTKIMFIL